MASRRDPHCLCRACYATAVGREPFPAVIEPGTLWKVAASVGRCVACGLEAVTWSGESVRGPATRSIRGWRGRPSRPEA